MLRYPRPTHADTSATSSASVVVPADRDARRPRGSRSRPGTTRATSPRRGAGRRARAVGQRGRAPRGCPRTASSGGAGEQPRHELVAEHEPRRVERLGRVRRARLRADLAPTVGVVGHDADEQRVLAASSCSARCGTVVVSGEPDPEELDGDDVERHDAGAYARVGPGTRPGPTRRVRRFVQRRFAGLRAGAFFTVFLATAFFLAGAFLAGAFLAGAFFATAFFDRRLRRLAREHGVLEVLERRDARDALGLDLHLSHPSLGCARGGRDDRSGGTSRSRRSQRLRRSQRSP